MKYCSHCGKELVDEAVVCPGCGVAVGPAPKAPEADSPMTGSSTLRLIAKIFMIIGCVATGVYLIPLCWTIPMTVKYWNAVRDNRPVSTGFKICSLIFVNLIAGILMLVDGENI